MRKIRGLIVSVILALSGVLAVDPAAAANNAMKDLMKKMGAATAAGDDGKALAPLLAQAKGMKPAGADYPEWDAITDKGKAAAEAGDIAGAKASCKTCHTAYRDSYKTKYGSKAP